VWWQFMFSCPISLEVLGVVLKIGGDSVYPIWRQVDTASLIGLVSLSHGRT